MTGRVQRSMQRTILVIKERDSEIGVSARRLGILLFSSSRDLRIPISKSTIQCVLTYEFKAEKIAGCISRVGTLTFLNVWLMTHAATGLESKSAISFQILIRGTL